MEKNARMQIDIKRFYKESSPSSEEERQKTKKAISKVASPPNSLCRLVHALYSFGHV